MTSNSIARTDATRRGPRPTSLALIGVLALLVLGTGGFYALAASSASFNNVQISIQTSSNLQYSYTVSAYNTTGSLVAYTQTNYPAAAFELPSGGYLFTVSAYNQPNYYPCNVCATPAVGAKSAALPVRFNPSAEYGYTLLTLSGPDSISIKTQNTTQIPTTDVTIKAAFVNGTAAVGAYVSAFVVGQSYYWWGYGAKINMYAQTDKFGVATLTVPNAPVQVTAGLSVPINLPQNVTTVTTNVGGQKVNVTVYWQPSYAYLTGSALLIPPANSASITLRYQQPSYYPLAYGASSAPGGIAYATSTPPQQVSLGAGAGQVAGAPSSSTQQTTSQSQNGPAAKIAPFQVSAESPASVSVSTQNNSQTTSQAQANQSGSAGDSNLLLFGGVAVIAAVVAVSALAVVSARGKK